LSRAGRYREVDALRGFALFGVLLVNLYGFGADSLAWDGTLDRVFWQIKHILFESKFWGLFSLLFGLSFWLQNRNGTRVWPMIRRFLALMTFGLGNALLFEGDILMLYAELGFVLLLLHGVPDRILLLLALLLFLVFPIAHWQYPDRGGSDFAEGPEEAQEWLAEDRADSLYSTGSLADIVAEHAHYLPERPWQDYQWPDSGFAVLGLLLVGYAMGRSGTLDRLAAHASATLRRGSVLAVSGLAIITLERALAYVWGFQPYGDGLDDSGRQMIGDLAFLIGTLVLTAAWFCLALGMAVRYRDHRLMRLLESVGRISLTTYLCQTLIFTTLFYGYGLGLAYRVGPLSVTLLALVIFPLQMLFAHWWLSRFGMGPVEWLWRLATDLRPRTLRATPVRDPAS